MTTLDYFNQQPSSEAVDQLLACCGSRRWAMSLAAQRPFSTTEAIVADAKAMWFSLNEPDWLEAFACHPRIGEHAPSTTEYLSHSTAEQLIAQQTLSEVAEAFLAGNRAYEARFGFRYIVFASGRTAPELLAVLNQRLTHTREEELYEAALQQHLITALRMTKWLEA